MGNLAPKPKLLISDWADLYAYLPRDGNSEPGKYRVSRCPYQREMLNDPLDPTASEFVWIIASQLGKTMCFIIIIEYFIDHEPASILITYPKDDSAKIWVTKKFDPTAKATPRVWEKLCRSASAATILEKGFPGGDLTACGVNSPTNLRQRSKRVVLKDEVDAYVDNREGDPCDQADKRAESFHNAVIGTSTTPTISGISRGEKKWELSDKQYFQVPCRKCETFQRLVWSNLRWPDGPKEAFYECNNPLCQARWTDQDRISAIHKGKWVSTHPERSIRGRHLSGLYQIIGKKRAYKNFLHQFVSKFLEAKEGGPSKLMVWTNTFLAEWWKIESLKVATHEISKRAEDYTPDSLPIGVLCVTCGIDLQGDRAELTFEGWGLGFENWAICHVIIPGDPTSQDLYRQIAEQLDRKFKRQDGTELIVGAACMDSGFKTDYVLEFCRPLFSRRVFATKGSNVAAQPIASTLLRGGRRRAPYYRLGTDTAKATIIGRLNVKIPGPGYCHFPRDPDGTLGFSDNYFVGLTCEEQRREWKKGREHFVWYLPEGARNEPLDCKVNNTAAITIWQPNWNLLSRNLASKSRTYNLTPKNPENGADAGTTQTEREAATESTETTPINAKKNPPAIRRPGRPNGRWGRSGSGFVTGWRKM